ncbi:MAG: T9SS type A sorting domain-containing protein [Bacteroidota bacterium]
MKKFTLLLTLICFTLQINFAQRYLEEVFTDVTVTPAIYGQNATIAGLLFDPTVNEAVLRPLNAEIYTPDGDTETSRPAIILLHTGNFLPPVLNGGCGGTIGDADMVNLATRLARKGYVAIVADYRIGWNPTDPDQQQRTFFLINAAYRGVQDARTCVRYLKRSVAEDNNPWGIDPDKIAMWGLGTGGYITYGAATLNDVTDTFIPKFVTPSGPMVVESINGDVEGTSVGVIPAGFPWPTPNDTLCYPNHVDYDSDFQLAVASGGALGDTSWIDSDDVPIISFQVPTDPFAPCEADVLIVPGVNFAVVEVMGACLIHPIIDARGTNDIFNNATWTDPFTAAALASGGTNGFMPFLSNDPAESAPWNFAFSSEPYGVADSDCPTDEAGAQIYVDSMLNFFCPRACLAMDLACETVSTQELDVQELGLTIQPNPAIDQVRFQTKEKPIESIYVYDFNGRLVKAHVNIDHNFFEMRRHNLPTGVYAAQLRFADGIVTQRVVFK